MKFYVFAIFLTVFILCCVEVARSECNVIACYNDCYNGGCFSLDSDKCMNNNECCCVGCIGNNPMPCSGST
uniref:Uncharacterized protein n=1 Tax=Acrobeloides nanus TaxID=290746 RepID=A0A914EQN9_9BILA